MICISNKELDLFNIPERIIFTNNGAYDLEQKEIFGYYTWVGYQHKSMRSERKMAELIEKFARTEVVDAFANTFNLPINQVHVEDHINTTDMFRIWVECDEDKFS